MSVRTLLIALVILLLASQCQSSFENEAKKVLCKLKLRKKCPKPPPPPPPQPVKSLEEIRKEIEVKTHDTFHQEVFNEFQICTSTIPKSNIKFEAPYLIKRNFGNRQILNYSQDWDWKNEYEQVLAVEAKINPEFIADFNLILDNTVELAYQNKLSPELMKEKAKHVAKMMTTHIPRKCETELSLNSVETIFEHICKSNKEFSIDKLGVEVNQFVNSEGNKNITTLSEFEFEELSILILSTNFELDKILNRLEGQARENVIDTMKNFVTSLLKFQHFNSSQIMTEIDSKIAKMYMIQKSNSEDPHNFDLIKRTENIFSHKPGEIFSISMHQFIKENRDDIEFFELVPMSRLKPESNETFLNEGLVNVNALSVTGTTPKNNGKYDYYLSIRYTYLKDGSIENIPIKMSIMVGQQQQKPNTDNFPPPQTSYKFEAIFTVVIVISVLSGAYIYRRIKLRQAQQNPHTIETGDDYEIDGIIERQSRTEETKGQYYESTT